MSTSPTPIAEFFRRLCADHHSIAHVQEKEDLIPYSFDGTATYQCMPGLVIFPTTTEEVVGVVKLAGELNVPLGLTLAAE